MANKKHTQNPRKNLRMVCPNCKKKQDSLLETCKFCGEALHPDLEPSTLMGASVEVAAVEEAIKQVENPPKGSPYAPLDAAYRCLRGLEEYKMISGMEAFIVAARERLRPYQVGLLKKTYTANLYFMVVLVMFAVVPLLFGWPWFVSALLGLPVVAWSFILLKAHRDYKRALEGKK